jgi:hypothetical protein
MQRTYKIYNLELDTDEFKFQSFIFRKVKNYDKRVKKLYRPKRVTSYSHISANPTETFFGKKRTTRARTGDHIHTFDGILKSDMAEEKDSLFVKNGKEIHDILILFSLMTGRSVCLKDERNSVDHKVYENIFDKREYGPFLRNYLEQNFTEDKLLKTGLIPAIFYYLTSRYHYSINIKFILNWIAFESLVDAYSKMQSRVCILPRATFRRLKNKIEKEIDSLHYKECNKVQCDPIKKNLNDLNFYKPSYNVLFTLRGFRLVDGIQDQLVKRRISEWNGTRSKLMHTGLIREEEIRSEVIDLNFLIHDILTIIIFTLLGTMIFKSKFPRLHNIKLHFSRGGYWPSWYAQNEPRFEYIKLKKT